MTKKMPVMDRVMAGELARVTEAAAVAAARLRGRGDEKAADQVAVDAMRNELNKLDIDGTVVIGEGERDEAPMLYIGEKVGTGNGPAVDIALDPLEGTTLTAKAMGNALAVVAIAEAGSFLHAPDTYMQKIAIGSGYPKGVVDLDVSAGDNIRALAEAKGVAPSEITACVLDRPRHMEIIEGIREAGAAIQLITDGDVAGVIATSTPSTGVDIYMGVGGAPEGVLAAAALQCIGGQMQGRLITTSDAQKARAAKMGVKKFDQKFEMDELASGDVLFAATGVTSGSMLEGVRFDNGRISTDTVVMRAQHGTVRWIKAQHNASKFS
ncbi:MAG: class II fructose-bisphosphatase [Hyphomicrobiales bacterium]